MYSALVLLGALSAVSATGHYGVIPQQYVGGLGYTVDETPKPYQFAYQAEAIGGVSTRQETADGSGAVVGSYSLSDEDGRKRVVDYVADGAGFRASVKTNEPGTKNESPADVPTVSEAVDTPVAPVAPAAYNSAYRSPYHYGASGSLRYRGYPYGAYSGALGYGRYGHSPYYGGALSYGGGGTLGYGSRYYGGALGHGGLYGGALGYGSRYYGGALGHGGLYGGALGYGGRYYGGALGTYGSHAKGNYGGYRGLGYGGYYPYGYGHGHGYRYGKHH